jgi:hypothetical protein
MRHCEYCDRLTRKRLALNDASDLYCSPQCRWFQEMEFEYYLALIGESYP